ILMSAIPAPKNLTPKSEIQNDNTGGGGGDDFNDFSDSASPNEMDIPTVEIHGSLNDDRIPGPSIGGSGGSDPQLIAMNEDKGLS
ncbi:MAG: hypothetical protein Q9226_009359, partial [Calogaya cf. arnoldii]